MINVNRVCRCPDPLLTSGLADEAYARYAIEANQERPSFHLSIDRAAAAAQPVCLEPDASHNDRRAAERAPARYRPRCPSRSVRYRCVQEHLEPWLAGCREGHDDEGSVPNYVEREFRRYLECGILAHGFARARCGQCGHDILIAFSCKGRAVCPRATAGAWGGDGGASHRSRLAGPAGAAVGAGGAEASALLPAT